MNIKNRLGKLERQTNIDDGFCPCGTAYHFTFVIGEGSQPDNLCPNCGRDVRPPTREDFANGCETTILLPADNILEAR